MNWQMMGVQWAPILTLAFTLAAIASIFLIIRMRRTARSTSFSYVRERSVVQANRLLILTGLLILIVGTSAALWIVSVQRPELLPTPAPTATATLIPSPTPRTPTPTVPPTETPTITPTPTRTPIPAGTDLPFLLQTPFPQSAIEAGPDAAITEVLLAAGEQGNMPIDVRTDFASGTQRIYAFFTFQGMAADVPWAHVWYVEVNGQMTELWGQVESWQHASPDGRQWRYFNCRDGRYELHVYIDRRLEQKISFTVGMD